MLMLVVVYTALFNRRARTRAWRLRRRVVYVLNWYQIWVGQGYTAEGSSLRCATCGASPSRSSSTSSGRL